MRASLLSGFLLAAAASFAQHATLRIPESTNPVKISLGNNATNGAGFASVTVQANEYKITFHPRNAVACAPATKEDRRRDVSWFGIKGMKLDGSLCFYIGQFGTEAAKHTLIAFVSEGYASDAAPVFVLGFNAKGIPFKVLERDELDLTALVGKPDGSASLIGKPSLSQVIANPDYDPHKAPYATTYDPFAVYVVSSGKPATYSLEESHKYNLEHYVWAGPESSESYLVLYNIPGHTKPFGAKQREANAVLTRATQGRKQ